MNYIIKDIIIIIKKDTLVKIYFKKFNNFNKFYIIYKDIIED